MPAPHCVGGAVVDEHVEPIGHFVQLVALPKLYEPGVHGAGAAAVEEQLKPAGQVVQLVTLPRLYAPAAHGAGDAARDGHSEPGGQAKHSDADVAPGVVRYVPAAHAVIAAEPIELQEPAGV